MLDRVKMEDEHLTPGMEEAHRLLAILGEMNDSRLEIQRLEGKLQKLEEQTLTMVRPGIWDGYVEDTGLDIFRCRVISVVRANQTANTYSFEVVFHKIDKDKKNGEERRLPLIEFMATINRPIGLDASHVSPRFWFIGES